MDASQEKMMESRKVTTITLKDYISQKEKRKQANYDIALDIIARNVAAKLGKSSGPCNELVQHLKDAFKNKQNIHGCTKADDGQNIAGDVRHVETMLEDQFLLISAPAITDLDFPPDTKLSQQEHQKENQNLLEDFAAHLDRKESGDPIEHVFKREELFGVIAKFMEKHAAVLERHIILLGHGTEDGDFYIEAANGSETYVDLDDIITEIHGIEQALPEGKLPKTTTSLVLVTCYGHKYTKPSSIHVVSFTTDENPKICVIGDYCQPLREYAARVQASKNEPAQMDSRSYDMGSVEPVEPAEQMDTNEK